MRPIKGGEICARTTLGKELGRTHGGELLGDRGRDELVDTDTALFRSPFYFCFDGARQTEWIGTLIFHALILRIASAGVSRSMP